MYWLLLGLLYTYYVLCYYQRIIKMDIETRLRNMADKWRTVNQEVYDICRDAAEEIRVLKVTGKYTEDIINHYKHGTGWGKGIDE